MLTTAFKRGHTLIEMLIAIAILGILLGFAAPNYRVWIANSQIRTAAETLAQGLSVARNEAIRRNQPVSFKLMTNLSASCDESSNGTSWVASVYDPKGKCEKAISEIDDPVNDPLIVAKKSAAEKTSTVTIDALDASKNAASSITFNGVGRVVLIGNTPIARIDIDSSALAGGESRELRILLTPGGMIRMCDPKATDSRKC
jgi:type IV fimbrial biogenesis protein FimT